MTNEYDISEDILLPMEIDAIELRKRASQCRELAATALTEDGRRVLLQLAEHYEATAISRGRRGRTR